LSTIALAILQGAKQEDNPYKASTLQERAYIKSLNLARLASQANMDLLDNNALNNNALNNNALNNNALNNNALNNNALNNNALNNNALNNNALDNKDTLNKALNKAILASEFNQPLLGDNNNNNQGEPSQIL
jgi:hypothetical protein